MSKIFVTLNTGQTQGLMIGFQGWYYVRLSVQSDLHNLPFHMEIAAAFLAGQQLIAEVTVTVQCTTKNVGTVYNKCC